MGVILKFFLIVFGILYVLRSLAPLLFNFLFSSFIKKASNQKENHHSKKAPPTNKKENTSDTLGEYIDYEEID